MKWRLHHSHFVNEVSANGAYVFCSKEGRTLVPASLFSCFVWLNTVLKSNLSVLLLWDVLLSAVVETLLLGCMTSVTVYIRVEWKWTLFLVMFERAFFTAKCMWKLIQPLKKNLRPLWICALLKIQDGRHNEKSNFQTFCWIFCLNPKNPPKNLVYESKRIMWLSSLL